MREILFRGLHRRKGEKVRLDGTPVESRWVYGGVCQYNEERAIIYQTEPEIAKFPVYAETVGQYTGLTDENGKKVFEGDIVRASKLIDSKEFITKFYISDIRMTSIFGWSSFDKFEVIGNIHDNPELLEVKKNEVD